jgi:RNA 2',3'-cyclic 3'-phosphodiesterase
MGRLFFAIWPSAEAAAKLQRWAQRLERASGGRAVGAESIHLTLAFLGDVVVERVAVAVDAARQVRAAPHHLPLEEARCWAHNRIVWAGPREMPAALAALVQALAGALRARGFTLERRSFAAHVTLLRKARAVRELPALPRLDWPVREFSLVRSTLDAKGSRYEIVARFPLDG